MNVERGRLTPAVRESRHPSLVTRHWGIHGHVYLAGQVRVVELGT